MTDSAAAGSASRARASHLLATVRLFLILVATGCYISGWLMRKTTLRGPAQLAASARWTQRWFKALVAICGIRVTSEGDRPAGAALYAPNHTGYGDVMALGAGMPCHFVAKADVERWPLVGFLFMSTGHLGITRKRDKKIRGLTDRMAERLRDGDSFCVFLEGTSTGGDRVLPFRSPLVQPAVDTGVPVVPVSIQWRADRSDIDVSEDVAYWKDHMFGPHVWRLIGLTSVSVHLTFGAPILPGERDRKALAAEVEKAVIALTGLPHAEERGGGYASPVE